VTAIEPSFPISPVKIASKEDDKLPPLLSMVIEGLLPFVEFEYVYEAKKIILSRT